MPGYHGPRHKGHITRRLEHSKKFKRLKGTGAKNQYVFGGITNAKKRQRAKAARRRR